MAAAVQLYDEANWELITRLNRDLRDSAALMDRSEARYLVDLYYQIQEQRQRSASQTRSSTDATDPSNTPEPSALTGWLFDQFRILEGDIKRALGVYASSHIPGIWSQSIHGIGPVISAGLLCHIDVNPWKCHSKKYGDRCSPASPHAGIGCSHIVVNTAGGVWRFAGLDPTLKWEKKTKRPWNARLKRLAWIIGDSFVKQRNSPKDFYGKVYAERKVQEEAKNLAGDFAAQAEESLANKNIKDKALKTTYEAGRLPAGRLDLRARRYAVKLFLAHYHHVAFEDHFKTLPPKPYVITHLNHAHYIAPPNWPI